MSHVYHFYATIEEDDHSLTELDGVIRAETLILTSEDYDRLKAQVAEIYGVEDADELVIHNLSLLHSTFSSVPLSKPEGAIH